ncbi:MAG: hypothetical protein ACRD0P_38265 [Stackebrandtia sp.]
MSQAPLADTPAARHPADPDPVPATKAATAYALSLIAVVTSPFVGGVIPAVLALRFCAQADAEIAASDGFLLGAARSQRARKLSWIALSVTGLVILFALVWWVFSLAASGPQPQQLDPNVN